MTVNLSDPVPSFSFAIKIQDAILGWFTECSSLTMEREVVTQPEGGVNDYEHQLPGPVKYSNITLKHGLADNALWNWFQAGLYDGKVERRNVSIILYHPDRSEARRWEMTNVYPVRWEGSDFKSDSDEISVETIELAAGGGPEQSLVQRALIGSVAVANVASASSELSATHSSPVELTALAEKVYALLKQDASIERERLGRK